MAFFQVAWAIPKRARHFMNPFPASMYACIAAQSKSFLGLLRIEHMFA
jgi:hypothetical protein